MLSFSGSWLRRVHTPLALVMLLILMGSVVAAPVSASPGAPIGDGGASAASVMEGAVSASIDAGASHTCAIKIDGTVACWGADDFGQATPPEGTFTAVSAGEYHSCAIQTDGAVACWGDDNQDQSLPPEGTFRALSSGAFHNCAIKTDGTAACWGDNAYGQATPPTGTYTAISAGGYHTCAIKTDGTAACWGWNGGGQATSPTGTFSSISAGGSHTCAIKTDGTVGCWGGDHAGQATPLSGTFSAVSAGYLHTCGIRTDGSTACWGSNASGQSTPTAGSFVAVSAGGAHTCGIRTDGSTECWGSSPAIAAPSEREFTRRAVAAGDFHTCAIKTDGTATCWGSDGYGQATSPRGTFSAVSAGNRHTCAIETDGSAACWGDDEHDQATPPGGTFKALAAGALHTCAIETDGGAACWGWYQWGQTTPPSGTFSTIAAGWGHTCAVRTDGSAACWGDNRYGQATPPTGTFRTISAGWMHTCAIRIDGTAACWGDNEYGKATPPTGTFSAIAPGYQQTCALRTDGSAACWGSNSSGQATPPTGTFSAVSAGAGGLHNCAIRTDGTVACWGHDFFQQARPPAALYDVTPPETTIDSGPTGTVPSSVSFTFSSSAVDSTFECRLDAAAFSTCTSPQAYTNLPDGPHTFRVRATDSARNTDATPAARPFTVDATPPQSTIDAGPSGPTNDPRFEFSSSEAGSTFECALDATAFSGCTSPQAYSGLAHGSSHTFRVRATDPYGNRDQSPAERTFTVDTVKPDTNIEAAPNTGATSTSATFEFVSDEAGSTFECKLDTGAYGACTTPKTYTGLSTGGHTFRVRAIDAAGNVDFTPATWTWTIEASGDVTPPTVSRPNADFRKTTVTAAGAVPVLVRFSASDASGISATDLERKEGTAPFTDVALPSATATRANLRIVVSDTTAHRLRAGATDNAGNTSAFATSPVFKLRAYQDGAADIAQSGTWSSQARNGFFGRSVVHASTSGASQSLTVTGTDFAIVSTRAPDRGKARVFVDGVRKATIDLYSAATRYRQVVYAISFPTAGSHTIELRPTGTKNASSSGRRVDLDAFLTMER